MMGYLRKIRSFLRKIPRLLDVSIFIWRLVLRKIRCFKFTAILEGIKERLELIGRSKRVLRRKSRI